MRTVFLLGRSRGAEQERVAVWGGLRKGGDGHEDESASARRCYSFVIEARVNHPG